MRATHYFQDGGDFYLVEWSQSQENVVQTVTAPIKVTDFDTTAAVQADNWFIRDWCKSNGYPNGLIKTGPNGEEITADSSDEFAQALDQECEADNRGISEGFDDYPDVFDDGDLI